MLDAIPASLSPAGGICPVTTGVISGGGEGVQPVGSPGVEISVGLVIGRSGPPKEVSKSTGCSKGEFITLKSGFHLKWMMG